MEVRGIVHPSVWKRISYSVLLAAAGALLLFAYLDSRPPKLEMEAERIDFGMVAPGTRVTKSIQLWNGGGGTLRIHDVHASCGCSEVQISTSELHSGETAHCRVTLVGRPGVVGGQMSVVSIYSNDPHSPLSTLRLHRDAVPEIGVQPGILHLLRDDSSNTAPSAIATLSFDGLKFPNSDDIEVRCNDEFITTDTVLRNDSQVAQIIVEMSDDAPTGQFSTEIVVSIPQMAFQRTIQVRCRSDSDFVATPRSLVLTTSDTVSPKDHIEPLDIIISSTTRSPDDFRISNARVSDLLRDAISCEIDNTSADKRIFVSVNRSPASERSENKVLRGILFVEIQAESATETLAIPTVIFGAADQNPH